MTVLHSRFDDTGRDQYGNPVPAWHPPSPVPGAFWWSAAADGVTVVVPHTEGVDYRDRFTVGGRLHEVDGQVGDYDHGPFGFRPGRLVVKLRLVDQTNVTS